MHVPPLVALLGWIPVSVFLFHRYSVRIAILANFFGGWAVLPGAHFAPTTESFPYWILGVCLPTNYLVTKAAVTGLAGLAGIVLFHSAYLKEFRPALCDLPMAVWCAAPLLSAVGHWSTLREGLCGVIYQTVAWGVPWVLGRIFFSHHLSLLLAAKAVVVAGTCYVPICLFELFAGPQLYAFVYGYQPYQWVGAGRYFGYRPIGFMEDGNQLGIWMAAAALVAIALCARRLTARVLGLPIAWVAAGLAVTTLLCQSAGSILLLLLLLPIALLKRRAALRGAVVLLVLVIMAFALFRLTDRLPLRELAKRSGPIRSIAVGLSEIGRGSFAWRFAREESHIRIALQKPLLGYGQWNWWQNGDVRPWSLWLLVFGMYGLVGLLASASILLQPVIRTAWLSERSYTADEANLRLALAALILMVAFDSLLNSALILPYLLLNGALSGGTVISNFSGKMPRVELKPIY